jgi:hypothetical protein
MNQHYAATYKGGLYVHTRFAKVIQRRDSVNQHLGHKILKGGSVLKI